MKELIKKFGTERVFNAIYELFVDGIEDEIIRDIPMSDILDYITYSRDFRRFIEERKK